MRFDVGSRSGRMFVSRISKRSDTRSMIAQGRSMGLINGGRGMTGSGFFDTLKKWYHTGIVGKTAETYNKYAPAVKNAYNTFQSDEVQKFLPSSIKNKTQNINRFAKKHGSKLQAVDDLAKRFGKTEREGVDEFIPTEKLSSKNQDKLPGDNLRASLLNQVKKGRSLKPPSSSKPSFLGDIKHGKSSLRAPRAGASTPIPPASSDPMAELREKIASRRSALVGSGLNPPGLVSGSGLNPPGLLSGQGLYPAGLTGSGLPWKDLIKMAEKMIPVVADQVQKGTGMSDKQMQSMTKMSLMNLKPILSGMTRKQSGSGFADVFKNIADAVITPLKLISNIQGQSGSGKCCKKRKRKKHLLNKMKMHIASVLAKSATRKQSGRGVSFSDVLGGIAQTASAILPFLL